MINTAIHYLYSDILLTLIIFRQIIVFLDYTTKIYLCRDTGIYLCIYRKARFIKTKVAKFSYAQSGKYIVQSAMHLICVFLDYFLSNLMPYGCQIIFTYQIAHLPASFRLRNLVLYYLSKK